MRGINKLLLVLLVTSVCFNLLFVLGYYRSRAKLEELKTPEGRMRLLADEIGLTRSQTEQVVQIRKELREKVEEIREVNAAEGDAFWEEIMKDDPDPEKVRKLVMATADSWMESRVVAAEYLQKILAQLTPQQREELVKTLRLRNYFRVVKTKDE